MVSVLIPVYNRKIELNDLLQSFVYEYNLNRILFEVIIIDDLSGDGSFELAKKYTKEYSFFKLIISGYKSPGMSRNIGSKIAQFDWLLFCDSDNMMVENWSILLSKVFDEYTSYDGIWFPARCNNLILTSSKYLKKGIHRINPYFYFNNYIGEVVHCIKKDFFLYNQYFYLKGTTNDFPDLLWFSLFSNNKYKVLFYDSIIQEYHIGSKNRISTDYSFEKNFSQIIHYKLVLLKILKTKFIFTKYFFKIVIKFLFFILIVDDNIKSLKKDIGLLRFISRFSFKIKFGHFLLNKLIIKRNLNEDFIR